MKIDVMNFAVCAITSEKKWYFSEHVIVSIYVYNDMG